MLDYVILYKTKCFGLHMWDVNVEILAVYTSLTVSCSGPTGRPKEAEDIKDVHEFGSSEMWFLYDYRGKYCSAAGNPTFALCYQRDFSCVLILMHIPLT